MSLLAEVLATAGQVEMDDLNVKINEITELISSLKIQVMETMENSYVKFIPHYEETEQLFRKAETVTDDMNDIHKRIEGQIKRDLSDSTGELKQFKDKLEISEFSLNLVNRLLKIYKCTSDAKTEQDSQKFLEASKKLNEFNSILINEGDELKCLDIYSALHEELINIQSNFSFSVLEQWRPLIKWHEVDTDFDKVSRQITLTIVDSDLKSDLIKSLHYYNLLIIEVNKFGDKLLNTILFPVINKFSVVVVTNENELESLLIEMKNKKNQSCLHVINNLTIIFEYLFKKLNVEVGDGNSFIIELGERISKKFCEHFITNCLDEAVPKRQEELNSYKGIIQNLRTFEELLHSSGFLQDDNMKLREYAENVDVLIANKICDSYLESARHLMKKDLHDTMEAGVSYKILDSDSSTHQMGVMRKIRSVRLPDSDHNVLVSELSPNTYQFPLCQISKSSYELIQLLNSLLDETAKSTTENFALKLFLTARNIFKLYCEIVPLHHKTMLNTIPQQSALLRNDCYYLAHELLMLGSLFKAKSAAVLGKHIITFVDIISSLRDVGDEILSNQLEIQQKQILDILRDSGLVTLIENPEFPQGIEKAIRQCTRQLLLLQKVWQPVLPVDTYCKTIGSLCNCFVNELVIRVCSTGDIPADTASELVRVFTIVQEKTPLVFPEPKEICQFVVRWTRFNELVRLLGANLRDVDERWADGKGPLAQEFTANQVKQMVKALFQISERRAAVLARIK